MKDTFLLKEMHKIGEMLLGKGKDRPTVRNIICELAFGSDKVNALMHGKDSKLMNYYFYFSFLFSYRHIKPEYIIALQMIEEAITKEEDLMLALVAKHTKRVIGEPEIILKHED